MERALAAQMKLLPLRLAFGLGTFPVVVRDAVNMIGIPVGPARKPVTSLTGDAREKLRRTLIQMGVL